MNSYSSVTISGDLIAHLRTLYEVGSRNAVSGKVSRYGLNAYTEHALAAYIIGVASVEAFVNETFISKQTEVILGGSALWRFRRDWLERLELRDKIILVTQLLLGATLDPGGQPLQDLVLLLKVRNETVHYKPGAPPKFMSDFIARGLALTSRFRKEHPDAAISQPWAMDMACTEGIRWAHNTCCRMVRALVTAIPIDEIDYQKRGASSIGTLDHFQFLRTSAETMAGNFREITDTHARTFYQGLGLDPDS